MTAAEFRPIFDRVCTDYGLSAESRATAWDSCFTRADKHKLVRHAVRCYLVLDRTRGPWIPRG